MWKRISETVMEQTDGARRGRPALLFFDRRTAERIPLSLPLTYAFILPGELARGTTTTINLSGWGVQFAIPRMTAPQTACQVTITLPNQSNPLTFVGRVVWCRQALGKQQDSFEVGVAFVMQAAYGDQAFVRYSHFIAGQLLARYLR